MFPCQKAVNISARAARIFFVNFFFPFLPSTEFKLISLQLWTDVEQTKSCNYWTSTGGLGG